ncbi:hypothetical protein CEXT_546331 [Caerostris extrusa]|uniref:Uncharacterized protein n=1 Tax=Caerostris extrusa TaxID=172846 RepID=A0AAV4X1F3_CAEEX|nr:hypothetical protein CEXT_546331 [Caerostris extrusa]
MQKINSREMNSKNKCLLLTFCCKTTSKEELKAFGVRVSAVRLGERRPSMGDESECHFRLVSLGGAAVGKSSILKRFLSAPTATGTGPPSKTSTAGSST